MFRRLKNHLTLLTQSPKDYIYSYLYSDKTKVEIQDFNPKAYQVAKKLVKLIEKLHPEVKAYLIGSTGLQIEGRGDIDLFVATKKNHYDEVKSLLYSKLGGSVKNRKFNSEWRFEYAGFPVEMVLTIPENKTFQNQIRLFKLLKDNKDYLKEYKEIKNMANNKSDKDYVRIRMAFFNKIMKLAALAE